MYIFIEMNFKRKKKKDEEMASMRKIPKRKKKYMLLHIHVCDNNIELYNRVNITIWIVNKHFNFHTI